MSTNTGIRERALRCHQSFDQCLADAPRGKLFWVQRCQADFNLWAYGLKANSVGKSSLDYRVRDHEDLQQIICDLLDGLAESLLYCPEASTEPKRERALKFNITTMLQQLSRIHTAIRRAGNHLRHQRADATIEDALQSDEFKEWREDMENLITMGLENEGPKHGSQGGWVRSSIPEKTLGKIQERLIHANLIRRNRIQHTRRVLERSKRNVVQRPSREIEKRELPHEQVNRPALPQRNDAAPTTGPIQEESASTPEMNTYSFDQATVSENQQTATDLPSKFKVPLATPRKSATIITKATQTGREQAYPTWKKRIGAHNNILCPYCAEPLAKDYITNDSRWRGHLAQDIAPYSCIDENCIMPELMYNTTEHLNQHILQEHGIYRWVCNYCAKDADEKHRDEFFIFDTAEQWADHVKTDHLPELHISKLRDLSSLSQKKFIKPMECPLCDFAVLSVQAELDGHIVGHLHAFALRALPWGLSQGSSESNTPRFSASLRSDTSHVSSRWALLSDQSDSKWSDHETPAIENWRDWQNKKDKDSFRRTVIEDWIQNISDSAAPNRELLGGPDITSGERSSQSTEPRDGDPVTSTPVEASTSTYGEQKRQHEEVIDTQPAPCCAVPFIRDSNFIERSMVISYDTMLDPKTRNAVPEPKRMRILDHIHEKLSLPAAWVALVGASGMGKTDLAIEYCYRTTVRSPDTWIFWVHVGNATRLKQDFWHIADLLRLPGRKDQQTNVFQLVHDWLRDETHAKWLLVLDNVNNFASLPDNFVSYLPRSANGTILLTSGLNFVQTLLVQEHEIIRISTMEAAEAHSLVRVKMGETADQDDIIQLAIVLQHVPLALMLAIAYIRQRGPGFSTKQYIEDVRRFDRPNEFKEKLLRAATSTGRVRENQTHVSTSWLVTFNHISSTRKSAADLLSLMSLFDPYGIPESLLRGVSRHRPLETSRRKGEGEQVDDSETSGGLDAGFEEDILVLQSFLLVTIDPGALTRTFHIHLPIQEATLWWLSTQGQLERWNAQFIEGIYAQFPSAALEDWAHYDTVLPHVTISLLLPPESEERLIKWALLLLNAGLYAQGAGFLQDAESLAQKSWEVRAKLLGKEHEDTLRSMEVMIEIYKLRGREKQAAGLELYGYEEKFGLLEEENPAGPASMADYWDLEPRTPEEKQQKIALKKNENTFGKEHPDTLESTHRLAQYVYEQLDDVPSARLLYQEAIDGYTKTLGADHLTTEKCVKEYDAILDQ